MARKKPYVTTEKAGPWLGGKRVREQPIMMTDAEAAHHLREGTIAPAPAVSAAAGAAKRKGRG